MRSGMGQRKLDTTGLIDPQSRALYERRLHLCLSVYGQAVADAGLAPEVYQITRVGLIAGSGGGKFSAGADAMHGGTWSESRGPVCGDSNGVWRFRLPRFAFTMA